MSNTAENLWAKALATLTADDRQHLNLVAQHEKREIVEDLLKFTEEKRDQCYRNRSKLKRIGKKGNSIIWWDVFGKIVKWIRLFIEVGDTAIQYDPGHAALPWAAVRSILQISVNHFEKFDSIIEGIEKLSHTVSRYTIFEQVYLRQTSQASDALKKSLTELYASILLFLCRAKAYLLQESRKQFINAVFHTKVEFERLLGEVTAAEACVDKCADLVKKEQNNSTFDIVQKLSLEDDIHYEKLRKLLEDNDGPIYRMNISLEGMKDGLDKEKRRRILEWISPLPHRSYHQEIYRKELFPNSGDWLLNASVFRDWKKVSKSSPLWLHGMLGSGKSTLTSIVVQHELDNYNTFHTGIPAYFYCSRSEFEPERSQAAKILASIARQLSSCEPGGPLLPSVIRKYDDKADGCRPGSLTLEEYRDLIMELVEQFPTTTIVIDALDECKNRIELVDALEHILKNASNLVKVFLSSRDEGDLINRLGIYPRIETSSGDNVKAVEGFVRWKIDKDVAAGRLLEECVSKDELKNLIVEKTVKGACGMFRWADMQIAVLLSLTSEQDIRSQLDQAPQKLEELYDKLYENIILYSGTVGRLMIDNVFKWLLCAKKPFKSADLYLGVSMTLPTPLADVTKAKVMKLGCSFIVFDEVLDVFRFAHLSVEEYLAKRAEFLPEKCEAFAAESCLASLLFATSKCDTAAQLLRQKLNINTNGKILASSELVPRGFHAYANDYWIFHCRKAGQINRSSDPLRELLQFFLFHTSDQDTAFEVWERWIARTNSWRFSSQSGLISKLKNNASNPVAKAFVLACAAGLSDVASSCLARKVLTKQEKEDGLVLSVSRFGRLSEHRSCELFEVLLKKDAEIETTSALLQKCLFWFNGHETFLEQFLDLWPRGKVTEAMLMCYTNQRNDGRKFAKLLDWDNEIEVTQSLLARAASLKVYGCAKYERLMDRAVDATVTEQMLLASMRNPPVMALLLRRSGTEINGDLLVEICRNAQRLSNGHSLNPEADRMARSLVEQVDESMITERVAYAAATANNWELLAIILERGGYRLLRWRTLEKIIRRMTAQVLADVLDRRPDMKVTHQMLRAALDNTHDQSSMRILLQRGGIVSQELLEEAAGDAQAEKFNLILLEYGGEITRKILAAAINRSSGSDSMSKGFDRGHIINKILDKVPDNQILDNYWQILERYTNCWTSKELVKMVLKRTTGDEIPGGVILSLLRHICDQESWTVQSPLKLRLLEWERLFLKSGKRLIVTEEILIVAAAYVETDDFIWLMGRIEPRSISGRLLHAAAKNGIFGAELVSYLLGQPNEESDLQLMEEILVAAASNRLCGDRIIRLLERGLRILTITEKVFMAAASAGSLPTMSLLLSMNKTICSSKGLLLPAARNTACGAELVNLLLKRFPDEAVTETVVIEAAGNNECRPEGFKALLGHADITRIAEVMVLAAISNKDLRRGLANMEALLGRGFPTDIPDSVFHVLLNHPYEGWGEAHCVWAMREERAIDFGVKMKWLNLLLQNHDLRIVSTPLLSAAASSIEGVELIGILMKQDPSARISEEIIRSAATRGQLRVLRWFARTRLWTQPLDTWFRVAEIRNAAVCGDADSIWELLFLTEEGAIDFDVPDNSQRTPLSWAAGSQVDRYDQGLGYTEYEAQWGGHETTVAVLLTAGADPLHKDNFGRTPLFWAAMRGHWKVVETLLQTGKASFEADVNGETPLSVAKKGGHIGVIALLEDLCAC